MLMVDDLNVSYGRSHVLWGTSIRVQPDQVVALLGRNGAGKTTTCRAIAGLQPASSGRISFRGDDITGKPAHQISRAGLSFVASGRALFGNLTVRQNLELAVPSKSQSKPQWTIDRATEVFPKLAQLYKRKARFLSGGERQMLKIARSLLSSPKLILLDEPTEGLAPRIVQELGDWLHVLKKEGIGILLAEQNLRFALRLADYVYIMEKGRIKYSDTPDALKSSNAVHEYLGV